MIVSGKNVFNELRNNSKNIKKVYLSRNFKDKEIINFIKDNRIKYETVDEIRLRQIDSGNHGGIILIVNDYEYHNVDEFLNDNIVVMLDHLEDPHNFGAIIRTCEAAGIKSIIIPKDRSVGVTSAVVKTSSGAIEHVRIGVVNNLIQTIEKFKKNNFFVYSSEVGGKNYKEIDFGNKVLLIIGSEGKGVSRLVKEHSDEIVSIPMKGEINSLNASVAAGILIYELVNK